MKKMNLKYGLIAAVALGFSANINAQDLTCDDITFNPAAFSDYQFVDQACQTVVERNGKLYAQFKAEVESQMATGTHIKYYHRDGTWGKDHLVKNRLLVANIDGKDIRIKDLPVMQQANVYLPAETFTVNAMPVEVVEEVVEEEYVAPPPPPPAPKEAAPVVLPTTAGPLPWLALFGTLFLMLGGVLRFSRKQ